MLAIQQISWAVKFIPDRPSEMVSGGYDCALLHFDFVHGGLLSKFDFSENSISYRILYIHP